MGKQTRTSMQYGAILLALRAGDSIRAKYPEIAELYRNGISPFDIVHKLGLARVFGVSDSVAADAVEIILEGRLQGATIVAARSLVPFAPATPDRISEIEFVFRLTADPEYCRPVQPDFDKIAQALNNAFCGGQRHYRTHTLKRALEECRGVPPPGSRELAYAEHLTTLPEYRLPAQIKAGKIALRVNQEYHGGARVRTPAAISRALATFGLDKEDQLLFDLEQARARYLAAKEADRVALEVVEGSHSQFSGRPLHASHADACRPKRTR